jgi:sugar lactone lactonase YvrE
LSQKTPKLLQDPFTKMSRKLMMSYMRMSQIAVVVLWMNAVLLAQDQSSAVTVIAGSTSLGKGYSGDGGPAAKAQLSSPLGIAVDGSGNLFIADAGNGVIRKVDASGIITTLNDHPERPLRRNYASPGPIAADSKGNIYLSDVLMSVVWKIDSVHGTSTLFAGTSAKSGYSGDGGPANRAELSRVAGLAVDGEGNVYLADALNRVVRRVDAQGIITTVAGNHSLSPGSSGDGGRAIEARLDLPTGLAVDSAGDLFIAENYGGVIRKVNAAGIISTVAGLYVPSSFDYKGDGGPATRARLAFPMGIAVDRMGNLYIADHGNDVVRKVDAKGIISTLTGDHEPPAPPNAPRGPADVAVDKSGNLFIAYTKKNVVEKIDANH